MAAKTFTPDATPPKPPCTGCDRCKREPELVDDPELFILVGNWKDKDERYLCKKCFGETLGARWPWPRVRSRNKPAPPHVPTTGPERGVPAKPSGQAGAKTARAAAPAQRKVTW